jgi:hypothetical protein
VPRILESLLAPLLCLAALALLPWSAAHASPPEAEPTRAVSEAPGVKSVSVDLTIWRAGEKRPDGERVPVRGSQVDAVAVYELDRPARDGERLVLVDFAGSMPKEPTQLDEVTLSGYVAGPFDAGGLELGEAQADVGGLQVERTGPRRDISLGLPAGATRVTLRYRVDVPHRYWPFGCVRRRCSLSGAVAPLPSTPARGGHHLPRGGRVLVATNWSVTAAFGSEARKARDEIVISDRGVEPGRPIAYPSVFWGPRWHRLQRIHHGVTIDVLTDTARPGDRYPHERPAQLRRDDAGRLEAIATEAVELAEFVGRPLSPDAELLIVQGPLRSEVAEMSPSGALVSDQFIELIPAERLTKFHEVIAARAMFDAFAYGWFVGRHDPSTDFWVRGAVGFALAQLWQQRREHRDEFARDLLRNFTFVPAVDRFLYTGQASFSSAYFRGGEDVFPVRNHPLLFANQLPTGRRIHEKLADLLAPEKLASFYANLLADPDQDPVRVAERAYGYHLEWFFDQWLGTYPSVDYAVGGVESERTASGYRHRIVVVRDADRELIEPVQVLVTEKGGRQHHLLWNGEATGDDVVERNGEVVRHAWTLETTRRLANVRVDPRHRFAEQSRIKPTPWERGDNNDPRFNNRHPHKARFLYTGVGGAVAVSEFVNATTPVSRINAFSGFAAFEGSLQRDTRRTGIFLLSKNRENFFSGGGAANFYFLRKRNRQWRRMRLRVGADVSWLSGLSLDPVGGLRTSQTIAIADETRRFTWWPEFGRRLWATVTANQTTRLDRDRNDDRFAIVLGGGWAKPWRLAKDHVIATNLSVAATIPIGSDPEYRSLQRAGGIGGLSGFAADELFGLGVAMLQAEYRHVYLSDMGINAIHLWWVRSVGGSLFGGVASVSGCESFGGWFGRDSYYGQVGYGLMTYLQVLGVTPQLLRLDVAVPLGRKNTQCLGNAFPDYLATAQGLPAEDVRRLLPPVNINLTFNHPF